MIRYLKQEEIDYPKWDECIRKSINSYVYAYSWYLDIVAGDWDALVEDDYQSVFPLPFRKKMGIKYVYQAVFTQQLGLFSTQLNANEKLTDFLKAIPKEFKLIDIKLNKYHIPKEDTKWTLHKNRNIELSLSGDYDKLRAAYSKNTKRNINKAAKHNLIPIINIKPEDLIRLFKENKGKELAVYTDSDYTRLGRLIYKLLHLGIAQIRGVSNAENSLIAAALFVRSKGRFIFLFSGLSEEGKEKAAMPFLIDAFIKEYADSGLVLDFEGSNDENLARFYRGFGAEEFTYYGLRMIQGSMAMRLGLRLFK